MMINLANLNSNTIPTAQLCFFSPIHNLKKLISKINLQEIVRTKEFLLFLTIQEVSFSYLREAMRFLFDYDRLCI